MVLIVNDNSYGMLNEGDEIKVYPKGSRQWIFVNNKRIYKEGVVLIGISMNFFPLPNPQKISIYIMKY